MAKLGRPAKFANQRTRGTLTIRLRDAVRSELERSAKSNGRSLSEEIEYQLEDNREKREVLRHCVSQMQSAIQVSIDREVATKPQFRFDDPIILKADTALHPVRITVGGQEILGLLIPPKILKHLKRHYFMKRKTLVESAPKG